MSFDSQKKKKKKEIEKLLMQAFQIDCQTLITRFELSYNIHFQNFCDIWKDMHFTLVFTYHPTETALTEFCQNALGIAKQFLVNASSLKERVGALYLLYAVYYKIPVNELKIRMTISDWKHLMDLHTKIKEEALLDANYILCKLIVNRAFVHCVNDNEFGIEKYFATKQEKPKLDVGNLMPEIKDLAAPGKLLSTINKLSEVYETKKRIVFGADEQSGLQLYDVKTANNIIKDIRNMQSDGRIFLKPVAGQASSSKALTSGSIGETNQKDHKRKRLRKDQILAKIGRAFEDGLHSESEDSSEEQDELADLLVDETTLTF
ncbi:snRNA-activating protein complex subunit 1 [Linepithema humile]|uniref:snRNA-activating protein complex subunit 1 n=1 Tax=Linepithema humile TaxID=83485 RepID=UPI0006230B23|nr:PREDICTED: snRNA-activating protein complex subunit 1 [Linepithema humile]XP_012223834.1 PREDICTED: snRNA-activating protein complex subunit 1 [Linepithema humile]